MRPSGGGDVPRNSHEFRYFRKSRGKSVAKVVRPSGGGDVPRNSHEFRYFRKSRGKSVAKVVRPSGGGDVPRNSHEFCYFRKWPGEGVAIAIPAQRPCYFSVHSAKGLAVNLRKASPMASTDLVGPVSFRKTSPCSLGRIAASMVVSGLGVLLPEKGPPMDSR